MYLWRTIVSKTESKDESISLTPRTFNYRMVPVTTVTLSCGHQNVYRGSWVPKAKVRCKQCPPKRP